MIKKKVNWQPIVKTHGSLLFQWYAFEGDKAEYCGRSLGLPTGMPNERIISGEISVDVDAWAKIESTLSKAVKNNPQFFEKFIDLCYQYSQKLIATSEETGQRKELDAKENRDLLSLYKTYQEAVLNLIPFLNATLALDGVLREEMISLLDNKLGIKHKKEADLLLSKLIVPKKKSFFVKEQESLLNIALKLQKNSNAEVEEDIEKHLEKFAWIGSFAYVGKFKTKNDVRREVEELLKENPKKKLALKKAIKKGRRESYQQALQKVKKSKRLAQLVDIAREFLYLKQYRLDVFFVAHYYVYPLFEEIGKRFGLKAQEIVYLTGPEIINWLKDEVSVKKEEVKKRMKNFALIKIDEKFSLLSGDEVKKEISKAVKAVEVKGNVANRGRANGRAKIVDDPQDMDKVEKGDIIVSHMTGPELMPALSKAVGIITDFGGMLSHAALVSRELGIPCIVGTEDATKVFKDGDLVELNAYDGMARILEKAK